MSTSIHGTTSPRPRAHARRFTALSATAAACFALALTTTAAPAQASATQAAEPVPQTDTEAQRLVDERAAEDPESLTRSTVPEGISVEQAKAAVEESDEITTADVEYAAAMQELPQSGVPEGFYRSPTSLPDADGALIKQADSKFYLDPAKLIEHDAAATTFMYKTTDERGVDRAATATLLIPKSAEDGPAEDAVIISPGTQGIADECAPSRQLAMGTEYEGISVASALAAERPVVIVDYVGLGTEGPHRFLNRTEEGRSVLDAARAVQEVEGGGIDEDTKLQLRGYSQGGHATTAALELADDWAPELNIASASAGAVPAELKGTIATMSGMYTGLLLFGTASLAEQADADLSDYLNDKGLETVERAAGQCTTEAVLSNALVDTKTLTKDGRTMSDLAVEEFGPKLEEQELGKAAVPDIPLLVNHSRLDDVVPFSQGKGLASAWCRAGHKVAFEDNLGPTHIGGYVVSLPRIEAFTQRTFAGKAPLDSCWRL